MSKFPPTPNQYPSEFEEVKEKWREQRRRFYSHPTNIPILFSVVWFFSLLVGNLLFSISQYFKNNDLFINLLLIPTFSGIGVSGFLMLVLGQHVNKQGNLEHGFWVYLLGFILLAFSLGTIIALIYF